MKYPHPGDYIDIHNHDSKPDEGVFILDNLMAHEGIRPDEKKDLIFSVGIHPWFLTESNQVQMLDFIKQNATDQSVAAIGEAGFDKIRGPSIELQKNIFEEQIKISEEIRKPLIIHCVRAWDELMGSHKRLKPKMPWLVHGFRGKKELGRQLISRNMYLSFWFDFIVRPEASDLIRSLPPDRIFFETDGSGIDIRKIYEKVADDLNMSVDLLKTQIRSNFDILFGKADL